MITSKKLTAKEIPSLIANEFISILKNNPDKWVKCWQSFSIPHKNPVSGTVYKGGNVISCFISNIKNGTKSNQFITFNQALQLALKQIKGYEEIEIKGKKKIVWKGEGERVNIISKENLKNNFTPIYFFTYQKAVSKTEINSDGTPKEYKFPVCKFYKLYNIDLFENLCFEEENTEFEPNDISGPEEQVTFFTNMKDGPSFAEDLTYNPTYYPTLDKVTMPLPTQFKSWEEYIGALAHEYTHATGHQKRLNRSSLVKTKEKDNYPKDELVAELAALMFSAKFGNLQKIADNSKNYLGGWIRKISDFDQNGKKHFMWAIQQAHKAFDYINENQ